MQFISERDLGRRWRRQIGAYHCARKTYSSRAAAIGFLVNGW